MNEKRKGRINAYILINVIIILIHLGFVAASTIVSGDGSDLKLMLRVISRGILGLLCLYNSGYFIFSSKPFLTNTPAKRIPRIISGILLGLVGLIGVITALLGYGINGDPIYRWWE